MSETVKAPVEPPASVAASESPSEPSKKSGEATAATAAVAAVSQKNAAPSNKELKELKKKEKAAKRAAAKAAQETGSTTNGGANNAGGAAQQSQSGGEHTKTQTRSNIKKQINQSKSKEAHKVTPLASHLETREQRVAASPILAGIVHPAILSLALKFSSYRIVGSTPRCKAMLKAFKEVINSYSTPAGTTLTRNLTANLSHQIDYLKNARPLSVSMGNTIRWLKQEISLIPIDMSDENAKQQLCEKIDQYVREKIDLSHDVIIEGASQHIQSDSTILTYGHSDVLEKLFLANAAEGKKFTVIIVDSRPLFEGKKMAKSLTQNGVKCQYVLINALSSVMEDVDYIMLGAHAMLSNGRLYSRVGTALIAMSAKSKNIPVLVCCESIKFSDKVQLDSLTLNELADGDDLVQIQSKPVNKKGFALEQYLKSKEADKADEKATNNNNNNNNSKQNQSQSQAQTSESSSTSTAEKKMPLADWKKIPKLNILNILYDLTPPEYIKKVITEVGALPPSSVPVILREYKNA